MNKNKLSWVMRMTWHDLLFAHWAFDPNVVQRLLPAGVELDLRDGHAWVGLIPFHMSGIRLRCAPPVPTTHRFIELNLRTYVRVGGVPGVWFITLDATSRPAIAIARGWFGLNYQRAAMSCHPNGCGIDYHSRRVGTDAEFHGRYEPTGDAFEPHNGSLEHFLVERYVMFARRRGKIISSKIQHNPWRIQRASLEIERESVMSAVGLTRPADEPHVMYAQRMEALIGWPGRVKRRLI